MKKAKPNMKRKLIISGHSNGLGRALAEYYLRQGDAVVLAVNHKPMPSARGYYRANLRHGVSRLHWGRRHTLGIIFHDAR